ncbi:MAG: TraR/DksA family transcriptional regulator [Methylomonas sp.]
MSQYQQVRNNLIDMLEELDERLTKITSDVKHEDQPLEQDFEEQATATENDQVLDALGNSARVEVEKIKQAISRIDAGTYGVCAACGESINPERLAALPYASLCIACAQKPA